ncbi:hypothetical protein VKT23_003987 [Stygiomarasmius scandens]|uniref:Uncharacterized protein n=1 Tax=Marasmiellus scandens TaxID=2682957 RepID=A0ABR1JYL7_9AGAR
MPNVLVTPPAEDNESPFMAFDAAQPLDRDYYDHDPVQSVLEPAFTTHRGSSGQRSIADILTSEDLDEYAQDVSVDSEVIEVVKLKRHVKNDPLPPLPPPTSTSEPAMKRNKTLRYRASRAFHSIKNVARSSRSKKHNGDSHPIDAEYDEPSSRAPSPSPSRRSSVYFSQLFTAPTTLKTRSSSDSFNEDVSPSPLSTSAPSIPTMIQPLSSAEMQDFTPYPDSDYDDDDDDDEPEAHNQATPRAARQSLALRSPSPAPSTTSAKLGRRRFSVLNIFTSTSTKSPDSDSTPTPPVMTRDPSAPSADSCEASLSGSSGSSIPVTPVDEVAPSLPSSKPSKVSRLRGFSFSKKREPVPSAESHLTRVEVAEPSSGIDPDATIGEMRLDSLHFDDLSFDAGRF